MDFRIRSKEVITVVAAKSFGYQMGSCAKTFQSSSPHCGKRFPGVWIVFTARRTLQPDRKSGSSQIAVGDGGSIPVVVVHPGHLHRIFICGIGKGRKTAHMFPDVHTISNRRTIAPPIGESLVRAQTGPISLVPPASGGTGIFGIQTNV